MSKNIVETLQVIEKSRGPVQVQPTGEEDQIISIGGVLIDATVVVEGGGFVNCRV